MSTDGTLTRWKLVVDNFIMAVVVATKIILLLNTPVKINVSILVVLQHWHLLKFQKVRKKIYIHIYLWDLPYNGTFVLFYTIRR